jgi:hypothetical protein
MPALRRTHDRHRSVRARLPAELAANTDQDRHLMSQTFCERCRFPAPMHWLNAGGDRSRPNSIPQCVDRALTRSKHPSKCLLHSTHLPYMPVSISPGPSIKSP